MKFDVQRTITMNAPLTTVRRYIEDFHHWHGWSPWTVIEPDCTIEITGSPNHPGHSMSWQGTIIGSGRNTVASVSPNQIQYDLEFIKPWTSKAKVNFTLEEDGENTHVTWNMESSLPFFLFFMIPTMKNWIGMDYDRGLRMLKEVAERGELRCETYNNGEVDYQGFSYVGIQRTVPFAELAEHCQRDFEKIVNDIVVKAQKGARHWVCIYPKFDMKTMYVTYITAVSDEDLGGVELDETYRRGAIKDCNALEIKHNGSYDFIANAWSMGMMNLRARKLKGSDFPFEQYWNSPFEEAPENLKSSVYFPL